MKPAAFWSAVSLTFPVWGTVVAVPLINLFNNDTVATLIIGGGVFLVALSSAPIVNAPKLGVAAKVALVLLYFLAATLVILLLGMILACLHKCN